MRRDRFTGFIAFLVMLTLLVMPIKGQLQDDQENARSIFQREQGDGFILDILLKRPNSEIWLNVPPDMIFHNGDRVKIGLRSNFDGFLYIVNIGTSGMRRIMVPGPFAHEHGLHKGEYQQFLVGELAGEPGTETLYIISAPTKIAEFEAAIANHNGVLAIPPDYNSSIPANTNIGKQVQPNNTKPIDSAKMTDPVITEPKKRSKVGVLKSVGSAVVKILGVVSLFSRELTSEYSLEEEKTFIASTNGRLKGGEFLAFELILRHE
ncbi:MAG: hypothetical protein AB1489_03410 [Acidobacteriota bacterium]